MEDKNKSLLLRGCKWLKVVYERFKQAKAPQWKHKECDKIVSKHKADNIRCLRKRDCKVGGLDSVIGSDRFGGYNKFGGSDRLGGSDSVIRSDRLGGSNKFGGSERLGGTEKVGKSDTCDKTKICQERNERNERRRHIQQHTISMTNGIVINFFNTAILTVTIAQFVTPVNCCYVFPPGKADPCEGKICHLGAICVSSSDGMSSRCQCPDECHSYGDSVGSTPVCGNDGQDYANWCELRLASCKTMREIKVKYYGKCSKLLSCQPILTVTSFLFAILSGTYN